MGPVVEIVIPWRPTPERVAAYEHVQAWYAEFDGHVRFVGGIHEADSGHDTFNRAASRNRGVESAVRAGADIVVVNDADTLPDAHGLAQAIEMACDGRLHFGYSRFAFLDEHQTAAELAGEPYDKPAGTRHNSSVLVMRADAWAAVGGQDERFSGYGGEDDAFFLACWTLLGTPQWHGGLSVSLHHADACRDVGSERWQPNGDLAARYNAVNGNATAMRALLAEDRKASLPAESSALDDLRRMAAVEVA